MSQKFFNPYHFVPLGTPTLPTAVKDFRKNCKNLSHARYEAAKSSGRIKCTLTTETPLVIGAGRKQKDAASSTVVEPYTFQGTPAIPATSLKGLISSLVEIISSSSLRVLNTEYAPSLRMGMEEAAQGKKTPPTIGDFFAKISKDLLPMSDKRKNLTPVEEMFGFVMDQVEPTADEPHTALAGKVRFSMGITETQECLLTQQTLKILATPKVSPPSFYFKTAATPHAYIAKKDFSLERHQPQGRKMYLHHQIGGEGQPWETADKTKLPHLKVAVTPIKKGVSFTFHIDFDNLSKQELGYLCAALKPSEKFRHGLGMGKSLGLGRCNIEIEKLELIDRQERYKSLTSERYNETYQKTVGDFTDTIKIPHALRKIGESHFSNVYWPVLDNQKKEDELFKWHVENARLKTHNQFLQPITHEISSLTPPTPSNSGARSSHGNQRPNRR